MMLVSVQRYMVIFTEQGAHKQIENFDGYMRDCSVWKPENYSNVMPREIEQFGKATRHLQSVDSIDEVCVFSFLSSFQ